MTTTDEIKEVSIRCRINHPVQRKEWIAVDDVKKAIEKLAMVCCNNHYRSISGIELLKELGLEK